MTPVIADLDELPWDHRFTTDLPGDPAPAADGGRRRQVPGAAFSRVRPTPVAAPRTLAVAAEVADLLGLDPATTAGDDFAEVFAGNRLPRGADPFAMRYGGHQFGTWAGQLGDGRAIALGEITDRHGGHQTLQLKGAGPTPYSRTADGRAVLRSSVREFLCSEAMHHLGIPTTRALSLVATGDEVVRDVLYDGHPAPEPGAIVCRVAPSFVRFGSFQLPAALGEVDVVRSLLRHTIERDFPELAPDDAPGLFAEVCRRTADLVVDWMRVGFVHGVLNTDNLSILGLTIDYGPYGWLEPFEPGWTPNTTDASTRRYRYGAQPQVVHWNLIQLANALLVLSDDPAPYEAALDEYRSRYQTGFQAMTATRLGWREHRGDDDEALVAEAFALLQRAETDYVRFFRDLARVPVTHGATDDDLLGPLVEAFYDPDSVTTGSPLRSDWVRWLRAWAERVRDGGVADDAERRRAMDALNPRFVLRNWLAQEAIDRAEADGDPSGITELLDVLRHPYDEQPGRERYAARRPEWARSRVGCSMLSCSS
ncbi:MAG TPA: YdiU family protein [Acidimicrobiales bacterium]|nr:YdiU family protein [Acidimicrobiales bacterium]